MLFSSEEEDNFKDLDTSIFMKAYSDYAISLKKCIKRSIDKKQKKGVLSQCSITFDSSLEGSSYYINVNCPKGFGTVINQHEQPLNETNELIEKIKHLIEQDYFQVYADFFLKALEPLELVKLSIEKKWKSVVYESNVKNIINSCIEDYSRLIKRNSNTRDQEIAEYRAKTQRFIDSILDAVSLSIEKLEWPTEPSIIEGVTRNPKRGFNFNKEATYNGVPMIKEFYSKMFNKKYGSLQELQTIDSFEAFQDAIRGCTVISEIDEKWEANLKKFITDSTTIREYITDVTTDQKVGNTLGELSLSYYRYFTQDNDEWSVLIVDQPEDNISNNNINQKLINYFQAIRNDRQLIFVTHNPLLVVNLDSDNVIYVRDCVKTPAFDTIHMSDLI